MSSPPVVRHHQMQKLSEQQGLITITLYFPLEPKEDKFEDPLPKLRKMLNVVNFALFEDNPDNFLEVGTVGIIGNSDPKTTAITNQPAIYPRFVHKKKPEPEPVITADPE
jgi:hypothetical protein